MNDTEMEILRLLGMDDPIIEKARRELISLTKPKPGPGMPVRKMTWEQFGKWLAKQSRQNSCGKKVRHASRELALVVATRTAAKSGGGLSAYKCIYCKKFHVGHTPDPSSYGIVIIEQAPTGREQETSTPLDSATAPTSSEG